MTDTNPYIKIPSSIIDKIGIDRGIRLLGKNNDKANNLEQNIGHFNQVGSFSYSYSIFMMNIVYVCCDRIKLCLLNPTIYS